MTCPPPSPLSPSFPSPSCICKTAVETLIFTSCLPTLLLAFTRPGAEDVRRQDKLGRLPALGAPGFASPLAIHLSPSPPPHTPNPPFANPSHPPPSPPRPLCLSLLLLLLFPSRPLVSHLSFLAGNYVYIISKPSGVAGVCFTDQEYPQRASLTPRLRTLPTLRSSGALFRCTSCCLSPCRRSGVFLLRQCLLR